MNRIIEDLTKFVFINDEPGKADIIFIPGSAYPELPVRAAELYESGLAPLILPSGKYYVNLGHFSGSSEYETEWDFMSDILQKNGVPPEHILKENESTFTYENAVLSRRLCDKNNIAVRKAILCCKSYHARRAYTYYQMEFPETEFYVTPVNVDGITKENWYSTECGFDRVMGEVTRYGGQISDILKKKIFL